MGFLSLFKESTFGFDCALLQHFSNLLVSEPKNVTFLKIIEDLKELDVSYIVNINYKFFSVVKLKQIKKISLLKIINLLHVNINNIL